MSASSKRFALAAELLGLSLIAAALWFLSPVATLMFVGVCLVLIALVLERRE